MVVSLFRCALRPMHRAMLFGSMVLVLTFCIHESAWAAPGDVLRRIRNPDRREDEYFGTSLAVFDGMVAIGAPDAEGYVAGGRGPAGAVYVYSVTSGALVYTLESPFQRDEGSGGTRFGQAVAAGNGSLLVGAPGQDAFGWDSGIAYEFESATGRFMRTYLHPDLDRGDGFGASLTYAGDSM